MKREKLYDNLINSGLVSEKHVGTKETFLSRVNSAEKASAFYNNLINSGLVSEKHVGTEDAFLKSIMPDFEQAADTVRRGTGDSTQQEAGFWHTWFGDALQRVTAGADNMAGNLIKGVNEVGQLPNYALTYAKTGQWEAPGKENTVLGKTASWLKGEAEDLRGKSQRYGTVTDENGMERPKNFKDLWKEGDYLGAVGETFLSASESLPVSLTAMAAGPAGLGLIGASTGIEKYDELSKTNPEMPWYSKAINAGTTGVIEGASERLGALFDTKLLKTLYKGAGASKAKGIFTNTLLGTLKESGVEGAEEVASAIGENVTDYMTGAADRFEPFKGVPESFVYGAAGGMQFAAPVAVASATGQAKQKQYINALITDAIDVNHYFDFQNLSAEEKQVIQTGYGKAEQRLNSALQNGSPEEFQAILDIVAMPMATQRKALQGIIDNSALNESQKMAIFNYVQKANARKGMENAMQTQIETAQKQAVETIRPYINPDMNAIVTVTTNGQQRQITGGNIILTEEGKIDMEKSSKEVYYTDETGKKQVAATGMIDLQEIIPAEEAVSRVMELVSTPIIAGHENAVTQPCNPGETVRTQDGLTGTVAGKNEDGTYQLSIPGMPEPVNVEPRLILSNLRGIETGSTVDFIDANGNVSTGEVEDTGTFESGLFVINGKEIPIDRIKGLHTENQNNGADNDNSRIIDVLTGKKPEQENENDKQKRLFYETLPKNSKGETDEKTMTDAQKLQHLEYKRGKEFAVDAARKGKQNTETEIKKLQSRFEKESDLMQIDRLQEQIDFLTARVKTYADYVYAFQKATMQANIDRSTPNQEQANEEKRLLDEQKRTETERANREAIAREQIKGVPDISRDSAKNARRRGYRLSEGSRIDRQPEITDIKGATVTRKFSDTETIPATRTVINAAILQPSHKNGTRNHHFFITEAQPKERTDDATLIAAENIAKNINPQEITGGTTAYTGAPIVNTRGEVIQGNNRTAALQQMYEQFPQQAVQYKQYLADHAADYGMTAEEINAMEHPVAADIIAVSDEKAIRLGQLNAADTESGGTQRIQPAQAAAQLGENLGRFTEILFNSIGEELSLSELIHKNAKRALDYLITKGIINNTQYLSAFDRQQNLKPEAKADMAGIATQALFSGSNDTFAQRFDMLPAKAKTAILQTIHRDSKSDEDSKLVNDIRQAVEIYSILSQNADFTNAKAEAETRSAVWAWSRQMHMDFTEGNFIPSDRYGNLAMELAVRFHSQTAATQRQIFNMLYDNLQGISSDMFIRAEKLDKRDAIKKHFNIEYNDNELQGSHAMADNSRDGEGRQQGSPSVPAGGKQPAAGKQPADSGRGTGNDNVGQRAEVNPDELVRQMEEHAANNLNDNNQSKEKSVVERLAQAGGDIIRFAENEHKRNEIAKAEKQVDTHPSEAQKKVGNYKKGHVKVHGFDISIEQPKGSVRSGVDENGKAWKSLMHNTYGYFHNTEGKDHDHIDVFIGENPVSEEIFVVDQVNPETGEFDEHKVMMGFNSIEEARKAYLSNYEKGWKGLDNITGIKIEDFRKWAEGGGRRIKPFAEYKDITNNLNNNKSKENESELNPNEPEAQGAENTGQTAERNNPTETQSENAVQVTEPAEAGDNTRLQSAQKANSEAVNAQFNKELQQQIGGRLPAGHVYRLGMPGGILQSTGFPNLPIELNADILLRKATVYGHDFDLSEIVNLPKTIQNPLAVFAYGDKAKAQNILIGAENKNGKKFLVGISLNPKISGKNIKVNSVRNVFPKDTHGWVNWINQGKGLYFNKEKVLNFLDQQRINPADVAFGLPENQAQQEHSKLSESAIDSATKIVQEFENPKLSGEKLHSSGKNVRPTSKKAWEKLIDRLKKTGLARNVITDKSQMREYLESHLGNEWTERFMIAWHGSPHNFKKFSLSKIGTGEGAQAYGWGLYFTDKRGIAETYARNNGPEWSRENNVINNIAKDTLESSEMDKDAAIAYLSSLLNESWSDKKRIKKAIKILETGKELKVSKSNLYEVKIHGNKTINDLNFIRWDNPLSDEQLKGINIQMGKESGAVLPENVRGGQDVFNALTKLFKSPQAASELLLRAGVDGIQYPSEYSIKGAHEDSFNYVVFDDNVIDIQDKIRFMSTPKGEVYGFTTPEGDVYLDPDRMNANTPVHEYGHLFWSAAMPAEMKAEITELLKQTPGWKNLSNNPAYAKLKTDDQKADELFNTLLGNYGEYSPEVREITGGDITLFARIQHVLNEFLEWLKANVFNDTDAKLNVFAKKTLGELLSGKGLGIDGSQIPFSRHHENGVTRSQSKIRYAEQSNYAFDVTGITEANAQEMQRIKAEAQANSTFMKAPNGKKSNLNERQWLQVRTKAFKRWFGNWEKQIRIEKLRNSTDIEITGKEIAPSEDLKQYRKNAMQHAKSLRGEYTNKDTGEKIRLSQRGLDEVLHHDGSDMSHIQSVAAIAQIIENSIYIETVENEHPEVNKNVASYDYYVAGLKIGETDYTVKAVIANSTDGTRYYDHALTEIEKGKLLDKAAGLSSPTQHQGVSISEYKDKRLFSILQNNSSKVVDSNGEPLVMHHSTDKEFYKFRSNNAGLIYFNQNIDKARQAARTGGRDIEVFLNIRNFYNNKRNPVSWTIADVPRLSETIRNEWKENNNDGVYVKDESGVSIAVFFPSQIKSTTSNNGNFDNESDDIRFQFIGEQGAANLDKAEVGTTRLDNLTVAREMEDAQKDAKAIKLATGWERGADGKWRYEIPDDFHFDLSQLNAAGSFSGRLDEILFHDELFAAYPKLRDVKLIVNDREQLRHFSFFGVPDAGAYSKEKNCIRINYLTLERSGIESLHSIFIHEIQHAIQAIEGFSYGSNTNQFDTLFKDTEDITEFMNLYEEYTQYRGKKKLAEWLSMPANFRRIKSQAIKNIVNQFKNGELGRFEAFDNLWEFHKQHYENIGKKQDAYKRTGGEVEARNAAFRMGMTPEERRASLAVETEDVAREDQIFLYDSLVNSNEVTTGNTTFANSKQNMTIVQMLEGTTPIETPKHDFKNIAEARSWAKENITGTYYNVNAGEDISVSRTSIDKYLSESAIKKSVDLDAHLSALKKLPQLIENSVLVERHPDRDSDNHIKEIQRLYSAINYKGKIFPIKITVKATFNDGNKAYSYEVLEIESPTENLSGNSSQSAPESNLQSSNNPDISTTVRDLRTSENGLPVSENGATESQDKDTPISENNKGNEENLPGNDIRFHAAPSAGNPNNPPHPSAPNSTRK